MKSLLCWEQIVWENYRRMHNRTLCAFETYQKAARLVRHTSFLTQNGFLAPGADAARQTTAEASPQVEHRLFALFAD